MSKAQSGVESGDEFLGVSTVTKSSSTRSTAVLNEVARALGDPDQIAWFVDDDGFVYAVPPEEVGYR